MARIFDLVAAWFYGFNLTKEKGEGGPWLLLKKQGKVINPF